MEGEHMIVIAIFTVFFIVMFFLPPLAIIGGILSGFMERRKIQKYLQRIMQTPPESRSAPKQSHSDW